MEYYHEFDFYTFVYFVFVYVCGHTHASHMPQYACRDQRATYRNWFSPNMWVPGTKVRLYDLATGVFTRLASSATYYDALYILGDEIQNKSL